MKKKNVPTLAELDKSEPIRPRNLTCFYGTDIYDTADFNTTADIIHECGNNIRKEFPELPASDPAAHINRAALAGGRIALLMVVNEFRLMYAECENVVFDAEDFLRRCNI